MISSEARDLLTRLSSGSVEETEKLAEAAGTAEADALAELILGLNAGEIEADEGLVGRLLRLASSCSSDRLMTVAIGTLWREDLDWLSLRLESEETARERMLQIVATADPKALAPVFWRAVAQKGPRFALVAFGAASETHSHEAARLLVGICRAALAGEIEINIREMVDGFLAGRDPSVRTSFLAAVKRLPEASMRKLMSHLDMSLMAELDRSAIEHRGESFFYDEEEERTKRDSKSKDIFDEVRRRLEHGEKPQL